MNEREGDGKRIKTRKKMAGESKQELQNNGETWEKEKEKWKG